MAAASSSSRGTGTTSRPQTFPRTPTGVCSQASGPVRPVPGGAGVVLDRRSQSSSSSMVRSCPAEYARTRCERSSRTTGAPIMAAAWSTTCPVPALSRLSTVKASWTSRARSTRSSCSATMIRCTISVTCTNRTRRSTTITGMAVASAAARSASKLGFLSPTSSTIRPDAAACSRDLMNDAVSPGSFSSSSPVVSTSSPPDSSPEMSSNSLTWTQRTGLSRAPAPPSRSGAASRRTGRSRIEPTVGNIYTV
ncbi:hypothetical protein SRABI26_01813 [Arthrobacter sp. Bi26]|nr:hypothetical protein SRABI26_01813 [Arthrobacter sp. Bi26]